MKKKEVELPNQLEILYQHEHAQGRHNACWVPSSLCQTGDQEPLLCGPKLEAITPCCPPAANTEAGGGGCAGGGVCALVSSLHSMVTDLQMLLQLNSFSVVRWMLMQFLLGEKILDI